MLSLPVLREPRNGRNRDAYQHAIDSARIYATRFLEYNPARRSTMHARVRWYSRTAGYAVTVGYTDSFSGGFVPIHTVFSR